MGWSASSCLGHSKKGHSGGESQKAPMLRISKWGVQSSWQGVSLLGAVVREQVRVQNPPGLGMAWAGTWGREGQRASCLSLTWPRTVERRATVEDFDLQPLTAKGFTLSGKTFVPGSSSLTLVLYPEKPSSRRSPPTPILRNYGNPNFYVKSLSVETMAFLLFPNKRMVHAAPNTSPGWMVSVASSGRPCHRPGAQKLVEEKFQTGTTSSLFYWLVYLVSQKMRWEARGGRHLSWLEGSGNTLLEHCIIY